MGDQNTEQAPVAAPSNTTASAPAEGNLLPPLSATSLDDLERNFQESFPLHEAPQKVTVEPPKSEAPVIATAEKPPEVPEPPKAVEPPATETPAEVQPPTETPKHETAEPTEPEKARILPSKIPTRQFSEIEQEAIALGKALKEAGEEVPPLKERIELVERRHAAEAEPPAQVEPPKPPEPTEVDRLTSELADLDQQLTEAGEKNSPFTAELAAVVAKRSNVAAQLAVAQETAKASKASADQRFETQRAESTRLAAERFPSAKDKRSDLGRRVSERIAELRNPDHADHGLLHTANAPLAITQTVASEYAVELAKANGTTVAEELAKLMGQPFATKTPEPPKPAVPAPQTKKVQPASGSAAPVPQPPAPDGSELLKRPFDPKAYDDWLDRTHGPKGHVMAL